MTEVHKDQAENQAVAERIKAQVDMYRSRPFIKSNSKVTLQVVCRGGRFREIMELIKGVGDHFNHVRYVLQHKGIDICWIPPECPASQIRGNTSIMVAVDGDTCTLTDSIITSFTSGLVIANRAGLTGANIETFGDILTCSTQKQQPAEPLSAESQNS